MNASLSILLLLLACTSKSEDDKNGRDTDGGAQDSLRVETTTAQSDGDGYVTVKVDIEDGERFQVIVGRDRGYLSTDYIYAPDGSVVMDWEDWYYSSDSLTEMYYPIEFASTANWPVREEDGPLQAGTYELQIATLNAAYEYIGGQDVTVEVLRRKDRALTEGSMKAVVAYAGDLSGDAEVVRGVEAAVDYWTELYAKWGITLTVAYDDIDVDVDLPDTYEGLDGVRSFLDGQDERVILVVVGETIADDSWIYGEAGGIPGPFGAYPHAAVFASWLANAGSDGAFSQQDIYLFGETLAHEVGHFAGLFHPVEDGWEYWDALEDTMACGGMVTCENNLGTNLMYPYPICYGATCERQDTLTDDQQGVAHRYLGVD